MVASDRDLLSRRTLDPVDIVTKAECVQIVRRWWSVGAIMGVVLPTTTTSVMRSTLRQEEAPPGTFDTVLERAQGLFSEWKGANGSAFDAQNKLLELLRANPTYRTRVERTFSCYGEALP